MKSINKIAITNISVLRKRYGYSQKEVGKKLNMSQNAYSELESGKTSITVERLGNIAAIYEVSVLYLLQEHADRD